MVFLITLIVSAILLIAVVGMQYMNGQGVASRIAIFVLLLFIGVMLVIAGITAPSGSRGVLLQMGAAFICTIPIIVRYIAYKNKRGWF